MGGGGGANPVICPAIETIGCSGISMPQCIIIEKYELKFTNN
jgi:hypothetical protein